MVGDSFIWGDGLTNINTIWWRQLQWELERRGYNSIDVIAAGTNGASTQDQYTWLTSGGLLEAARPDVIVVGYVTNDPQMKDSNGIDIVKQFNPKLTADDPLLLSASKILPNLGFQLASRADTKSLLATYNDETGYPYSDWEQKILEGENFRAYKRLLTQLSKRITDIKIPTVFITTPNSVNPEYFESRYKPVSAAFSDAGIEFHDLLPALVKYSTGRFSGVAFAANPANGHPGPELTHFYAVQVADFLESQYSEILGPKGHQEFETKAPAINDWMPASIALNAKGNSEWKFVYPNNTARLLRMPLNEPHVALNFERSVAIQRIDLTTTLPGEFTVWATVLDPVGSYELKGYVFAGEGSGTKVSIALPAELSTKRVTSLRIARKAGGDKFSTAVTLNPKNVNAPESGNVYYYAVPGLASVADDNGVPMRSKMVLLENGTPLPYPHSIYDEIRKLGKGRYSHWNTGIYFSSSDGSDPRTNGKRYTLSVEIPDPVTIHIDFNSPAVRL